MKPKLKLKIYRLDIPTNTAWHWDVVEEDSPGDPNPYKFARIDFSTSATDWPTALVTGLAALDEHLAAQR